MPIVLGLADLIFALVAALLLWAIFELFRPMLVSLASHIPLIGGQLSGLIDLILTDAYHWAAGNLKSTVRFMLGILMAPVHWIANIIDGFVQLIDDLRGAVWYLRYAVLPRALAALWSSTQQLFASALHYAYTLYQSAIVYTQLQITQVYGFIDTEVTAAEHYTTTLFDEAITYTDQSVSAAEHYTQALFTAGEAYTAASLATAEQYAQALFTQAITYTGVQVTDLGNWASATITADMAWVAGRLTALDRLIAADQAAVLAYVGTAVGAVELDLSKLKIECTDNLCSGLGDLARLFNALSGDLGLAGLFALAGEFAAHPSQAAADVESVLGPIARGAADTVRAAVGVG